MFSFHDNIKKVVIKLQSRKWINSGFHDRRQRHAILTHRGTSGIVVCENSTHTRLFILRWCRRYSRTISFYLKSMWNVYGCERDRTNFAILNFSATVDLLEKTPQRSSAELLEGELRSRLSSERSNLTEEFRLQVLFPTVLFHMLLNDEKKVKLFLQTQRLQQQLTTDDVALTGLRFFSITRNFMLTVSRMNWIISFSWMCLRKGKEKKFIIICFYHQ